MCHSHTSYIHTYKHYTQIQTNILFLLKEEEELAYVKFLARDFAARRHLAEINSLYTKHFTVGTIDYVISMNLKATG